MKSTPFVQKIEFANRESIHLSHRSVLALVGANNAGKTYFLNQLRSYIHGTTVEGVSPNNDLFTNIVIGWTGAPKESTQTVLERVESVFIPTVYGYTWNNGIQYANQSVLQHGNLQNLTLKPGTLEIFSDLFVEFDDAIDRVKETELQTQFPPHSQPKRESLTQLAYENVQASEQIRTYFSRIFHQEISYYELYGRLGFLLKPPLSDASSAGYALDPATIDHMEQSPKMWHQGLGMRSVLGLLLKIFAVKKEIIIVDEPEAFLHPPQAAALGSILSEIAESEDKQIILATHDRNLLNGLIKKSEKSVSIQRLTRNQRATKITSINPIALANVRSKSLIRYSTLFDTLFVRLTVLVENEKDALFYSEVIEQILDSEPDEYPNISIDDILFVSTGGTGAIARTTELIKTLNSEVIIACDLDLLTDRAQFLDVVRALTGGEASAGLIAPYESMLEALLGENKKPHKRVSPAAVKNGATNNSAPELQNLFSDIFKELDQMGVVLVPFGELEDFAFELIAVNGKAEWVQTALHNEVHKSSNAIDFGKRILCHVLT